MTSGVQPMEIAAPIRQPTVALPGAALHVGGMSRQRFAVVLACSLVFSIAAALPASAVDVWTDPAPGVRYLHRSTDEPREIHALVVDLTVPGLRLRATRASEKGQTVSAFAAATGAVAAVNADFFDGTLSPIGLAVGEGERWQDDRTDWFALTCTDANECALETDAGLVGDGVHTAVSGKNLLVKPGFVFSAEDDAACGDFCTIPHPRTAVGLSDDGTRLILVVVEGRQSPILGMRLSQLATLMVELGAARAVNLDGGGSSAMVVDGTRVSGRPTNEPDERRVANHLAILRDDGPATGRLVGFVREGRIDAADRPVTGATVTLASGEQTTTDDRGFYEFAAAPAGPVTITAVRDGFVTASIDRDVARATTTWGSIALQAVIPDPPPDEPADEPTTPPTDEPTDEPTTPPTDEPTDEPTTPPTDEPNDEPTTPPTDAAANLPADDADRIDLPTSTAGGCATTTAAPPVAALLVLLLRRRRVRAVALAAAFAAVLTSCGEAGDGELGEEFGEFDVDSDASAVQEIRFGEETAAHPAVGLLEITSDAFFGLCSATLIGPDAVLTAAHCVQGAGPDDLFFGVGADSTLGGVPSHRIASVAMAPGFVDINDPNVPDIAVLRLHDPVTGVTPLALSSSSPPLGTTLLGIGFGRDETNDNAGIKRSGTMVLETTVVGSATLPGGGGRYQPSILKVRPGSTNQLACPGDSGGPLLNGAGAIVGVASFITYPYGTPAAESCSTAFVAGYASVVDAAVLVQSLLGSLPAPPPPGACRVDDAAFSSADGGCRDNRSGLVFGRRLPRAQQSKAAQRCRELVEGGFDDWRLPSATELRGMARRGGRNHLQGGGSVRVWSKSRDGADGVTVLMSSGSKARSSRDRRFAVYCVRG